LKHVFTYPIHAVQHFPKWFPGTYYATFSRSWRWAIRKLHEDPYELIVKQMVCCDYSSPYNSTNL
jgi:hypothetical protein